MEDQSPRVGDVMSSPPVVVRTYDSLARALDRFAATGQRHLVVLDERDAVLGVLDDRRLAAECLGDALHLRRLTVGALLAADPRRHASVHRDTPVPRAAASLVRQGVDALPVISDDGRVAGVVDAIALLRSLVNIDETLPAPAARPAGRQVP